MSLTRTERNGVLQTTTETKADSLLQEFTIIEPGFYYAFRLIIDPSHQNTAAEFSTNMNTYRQD